MVTRAADLRPNERPIDKDVKVPAAVLRAAAAADAAQKAAYPDQTIPEVTPAPTPAPGETITIAEPTPAPQPEPAPAPQPAPAAVTPQGNDPAPRQWPAEFEAELHRVRSAEGRKRAQLETQVAQSADRIAMLENNIQDLMTRAQQVPAVVTPPVRLISEQEQNEFGPEMLDVMGRRATEIISPQLAELREMMGTLQNEVKGTVQITKTNAKQAMLASLDSQLPEWRQINVTDAFKAWLALQDPLFGATRLSALTKAYNQHDTGRVLAFFKSFVSELAATTPADYQPEPSPAPQPAKPGLESLAAPGRARMSAQPNAPAEKQIITTADVNAFYDAVRKGFYNGREAEKLSLEQELFAAQREGRVRAV